MPRAILKTIRLLSASALLLLGACGAHADEAGTNSAGAGEETAFPVTIEHKFGKTTLTKAPERVVVVGLREQDALLALGIVPIATTEWFGGHPGAVFPWAEDELGNAPKPTVLDNTDGVQIERVAAARPDLIIGIYSALTTKEYTTLSKLAPTVAQPRGIDYGSAWQDETLTVGKAVGKPREAERLVADTEAKVAAAADAHPEFNGQTGLVASTYQGAYVYGPKDARSRLMVSLGFTFPKGLEDIGGGKEFGGQLASERYDLLDVGALVWFADGDPAATLRRHPIYSTLAVRKEERDVFLAEKGEVYEASSFITVLSLPTLLDGLVPRIAAAADGDPRTSTGA